MRFTADDLFFWKERCEEIAVLKEKGAT